MERTPHDHSESYSGPHQETLPRVSELSQQIGEVYHAESRRVFATLIRLLGDFDRAEEAFHTCCHPALSQDAQVALTLREVCGLTTEEIARAFLTAPATLAQWIVRAKAKIKKAAIPYEVPSARDAFQQALALTQQEPERRFLEQRLAEL